jgi:hypothetical protein
MKIRKLVPGYGAMVAFAGTDTSSRGLSSLISEIAMSLSRRDERLMILDTRGIEHGTDDLRKPKIKARTDESASQQGRHNRIDSAGQESDGTRNLPLRSSVLDISRIGGGAEEADERLTEGDDEVLAGLSDYLGFLKLHLDEVKLPGPDYGIDVIQPGRVRLHAEALATHRMRDAVRDLKANYSMILVLTDGLSDSVALATMLEHVDGVILVANETRPGANALNNFNALSYDHASIFGQVVIDVDRTSN